MTAVINTALLLLIIGAIAIDQQQFDEYQFNAKEQQAFGEIFGKQEQELDADE